MSVSIVPLGELCEMDRQGLHPDDPTASGFPFVGVEHVESESGAFNFDSGSRIGSQRSATFRFDQRHILYGKLRPYLNKVATPGFAGRCSTELVPLLPRPGVDREFIAYLLRRRTTVEYVMSSVTGARMPRTDMKALMSLQVPLLPLDEQRRIVGILNRAAKIERVRKRAQELMGEFIPALFVRMFGDPVENPMGWDQANIGDLSQVQSGLQVTKKRYAHPIETPYLRVANVLRGRLDLTEIKYMRVTEREFERVQLRPGDLLIVEGHGNASEIGRAGLWDGSICGCVHQNHLIRARPDQSKILSEFVCAYLNSSSGRKHLLRSGKTTSGLNTITSSNVKSCDIYLPPLDLQRRFTQLVETARSTVAVAETAFTTASELSASLMSRLLGEGA
ncbi:MAG: restriction endonuclease subunit S [Gammaproteobacteria bacterium]|nr:restriction endonuclease subunit S [Gammaproteobacteria bacterium]